MLLLEEKRQTITVIFYRAERQKVFVPETFYYPNEFQTKFLFLFLCSCIKSKVAVGVAFFSSIMNA